MRFLTLFMILFFAVSCGDDSESSNKCADVTCDNWERCVSSTGKCELKADRCLDSCSDGQTCDANHNCVDGTDPCKGVLCSNHGSCTLENTLATCSCHSGFHPDGLNCIEDLCTNGDTRTGSCGSDGETEPQICEYGYWKSSGDCSCKADSSRIINCGTDGTQKQICANGVWENDGECMGTTCTTGGATRTIPCGHNSNGTQDQICLEGLWVAAGECADPDQCQYETTQIIDDPACAAESLNGRGQKKQICSDGQWSDYLNNCIDPDICKDGATEELGAPCGINNNGKTFKLCIEGQWREDGHCNDPDLCVSGATKLIEDLACDGGLNGRGGRKQICQSGQWVDHADGCVDPDICIDDQIQNIGSCGDQNELTLFQICVVGQWGAEQCGNICEAGSITTVSGDACGLHNEGVMVKYCVDRNWSEENCSIWREQWGSNEQSTVSAVAADGEYIYVVGSGFQAIDGEPHGGALDLFLTKYDRSGTKVWTRMIGVGGFDFGYDIILNSKGEPIVIGGTNGRIDGTEEPVRDCGKDSFYPCYDLLVAHFNTNGVLQWARQYGEEGDYRGHAVAINALDQLYITGNHYFEVNSEIYSHAFIAKLNGSGDLVWLKDDAATGQQTGTDILLTATGEIVIVGKSNPSTGSEVDLFLSKYNPAGTFSWRKEYTSKFEEHYMSGVIDSEGNIIVALTLSDQLRAQLIKFDPSGEVLWDKVMGNDANITTGAVVVNSSDEIFFGGTTFGAFPENSVGGNGDNYIAKYSKDGVSLWVKQFGTAGVDSLRDFKLSQYGEFFIAGEVNVVGGADGGDPVLIKWQP